MESLTQHALLANNASDNSELSHENGTSDDDVYSLPFYVIERLELIIPVSVIGVVFNILNILVLTRKCMRSSMNVLFTGLAVADLAAIFFEVVVPMIVQASQPSEVPLTYSTYTLGVISFLDYSVAFWVVTVSNWITVTVATWRYVAVTWPLKAQVWCTSSRAKAAIVVIGVACAFVSIPSALLYDMRLTKDFNASIAIYEMIPSPISQEFPVLTCYQSIYMLMKIVPSAILIFVTIALIRTLCRAAVMRRSLQQGTFSEHESRKQVDRTTAMMLLVVLIFLISNLPYSVVLLLDFILGIGYLEEGQYRRYIDYFQFALLINYSVTFLIYCVMCRHFRQTLRDLFVCVILRSKVRAASSSATVEIEIFHELNGGNRF